MRLWGPPGASCLDTPKPCRARQADVAAFGRQFSRDQVEQRRFAGAVAPDEADTRASRQRRGRVVEKQPAAEPERQVVDLQHRAVVACGRPNRNTQLLHCGIAVLGPAHRSGNLEQV